MDYAEQIKELIKALSSGGVVIFPTDTVYAISCDYDNIHAIKKLYNIKHRNYNKVSALITDSLLRIENLIDLDKDRKDFINYSCRNLSGSITFIVNCSALIRKNSFIVSNDRVAFRITKHLLCCNIIKAYQKPILATSVNISGDNSIIKSSNISRYFIDLVNYTIFDDCNINGFESAVIDITGSTLNVIRKSRVNFEHLIYAWNRYIKE
ncbi:threonylcarbamoyl-AMP synthase [Anaplasmataceae bacterium AB001_6]|nr:threonylcarbamoyl-AMP synthase [Anaplasmataceae bacterium AB001_6]